MTTPDLDELEAVGNAAYPAPWSPAQWDANLIVCGGDNHVEATEASDTTFIATARNNWDWLIAQARAVERIKAICASDRDLGESYELITRALDGAE